MSISGKLTKSEIIKLIFKRYLNIAKFVNVNRDRTIDEIKILCKNTNE